VLVEGESLFNDGTALVLFRMMVVIALTGQFSLAQGLFDFFRVAAGGLIVGVALGWAASLLIARIDDYLIETSITTVLAFGSYLLAERLQFSGVLAVVAAGLVNGNLGPRGMSPTTRIVLFNFWEYIAFVANSLVFLLIGLKVDIPFLISAWQPILWGIGAVIAARVLVVYGLGWLANRLGEPISMRWKHVLTWGGLRGALSLALALSLPAALGAESEQVLAMTFGVVLFTLLIQATTMRPLVAWLGIITTNPLQIEYEKRHAELTASKAAELHLERRHREGLISTHTWETLKPKLQEQSDKLSHAVRAVLKANPTLEAKEMDIARREILRAKRSAYLGLRRDGVISEEAFGQLSSQVDALLDEENAPPDPAEVAIQVTEEEDVLGERELVIEGGAISDGRKVRHIPWPRDFLITRLQRGGQTIVPNGDTILQAGDVLITLASEEAYPAAEKLCRRPKG
jgi:CPA1 family monovalent cation:H+ antiporter